MWSQDSPLASMAFSGFFMRGMSGRKGLLGSLCIRVDKCPSRHTAAARRPRRRELAINATQMAAAEHAPARKATAWPSDPRCMVRARPRSSNQAHGGAFIYGRFFAPQMRGYFDRTES